MTDLRLALTMVRAVLKDYDLIPPPDQPAAFAKALVAFEVVGEHLATITDHLDTALHDAATWRDYYTAADSLRRDAEITIHHLELELREPR